MVKLKEQTLKELGKYFLDTSKIIMALTLIAPLMKSEHIEVFQFIMFVFVFMCLMSIGIYLINKGEKDDECK